jgi:hypothetical protein
MRFNRFGGGYDDFGGGGRHNQQGFSDGLVEGLLVRRGIDRQNKFDKLNEQYAKKEMEIKEQEERDRVLQAALQRRKMEIDNQFAPQKAQADIAQSNAATGYNNVQAEWFPKKAQADILQSNASAASSSASAEHNRALTETENLTRVDKKNKLIAEAIRARRAGSTTFEPTEAQVQFYAENPDQYWGLPAKSRQAVDSAAQVVGGVTLPKRAEVSSFKPTQGKDDVRKMVASSFGKIESNQKLEDYEKQEMLAGLYKDYPDHIEAVETIESGIFGDSKVIRYKLKAAPAAGGQGKKKDTLGIL